MRPASAALSQILTGSFSSRLIVDSFYGSVRSRTDLGVGDWELTWNSEAEIKAAGTLSIVYTDDLAATISPRQFTDTLAPYGQEVNMILEISAGESFVETVQLGRYRITAVPDARDKYFQVLGQTLTVGSRVELTLEDRMVRIRRWGFRSDQAPASFASCWAELQRITGMQIIRSVADQVVPSNLVYKAVEGGRLVAVQALAQALGGVAYVTPDGALSVLSNSWGSSVATLLLGEDGTIIDVGMAMESEDVANEVVGNFEDPDRNPLYAVATITQGPLAVSGPYGTYTRYVTNDTVKTAAAAKAYVDAELSRVSSRLIQRVPVQCVMNPLIEDGDVITVQRMTGGNITGRVVKHKLGTSATMSLEMDVLRNV